jgi:ethanolamine utilization protein EutA
MGDMGQAVGQRIAARLAGGVLPWRLLPVGSGIRATALGLSEYSVQLSGNTIYVSDADTLLPRRNLRVIAPDITLDSEISSQAVAHAVSAVMRMVEPAEVTAIALAFRWRGLPLYSRIRALGEGIISGLAVRNALEQPVHILLDGDIARTLGTIMTGELGLDAPLLVVDGIVPSAFDYVDFGRQKQPSNTIPVTIKSLLFDRDPRAAMPAKAGMA